MREGRGVEFVILDGTDDGLRGRDMGLIDLSKGCSIYRSLQMEFLFISAVSDVVVWPFWYT